MNNFVNDFVVVYNNFHDVMSPMMSPMSPGAWRRTGTGTERARVLLSMMSRTQCHL